MIEASLHVLCTRYVLRNEPPPGEVVGALASIPIWAFHAEDDTVVPVDSTDTVVAAVKAAGNTKVKYTRYGICFFRVRNKNRALDYYAHLWPHETIPKCR